MDKFELEQIAITKEQIHKYDLPWDAEHMSEDEQERLQNAISRDFLRTTSDINNECLSKTMSLDMQVIKSCISIVESLNSHLKVFNQNARSEFQNALDKPMP
jgi:hypothetical protein